MSARKPTLAEQIAALRAQIDALTPAPAKAKASESKSFYTKAEIAQGGGFPCTVSGKERCTRRLRTAAHADKHGLPDGHISNL